jgi:hypothetical protein
MRHHHRHQPATIAILGGDQVVANTLAVLLESEGYITRLLEAYPAGITDEPLDVLYLVLFAPGLSSGVRGVLLSVVRGNPRTAQRPALTLSTAFEETSSDKRA